MVSSCRGTGRGRGSLCCRGVHNLALQNRNPSEHLSVHAFLPPSLSLSAYHPSVCPSCILLSPLGCYALSQALGVQRQLPSKVTPSLQRGCISGSCSDVTSYHGTGRAGWLPWPSASSFPILASGPSSSMAAPRDSLCLCHSQKPLGGNTAPHSQIGCW